MRFAWISDIHGNMEALRAVWNDIQKQRIDHIVCAGDLVSFGPRPAEVVAFVMQEKIPCVIGNHDAVAAGRLTIDDFTFRNDQERCYIRDSLSRTMALLQAEHTAYLAGLSEELSLAGGLIAVRHSVPDLSSYPSPALLEEYMRGRGESLLVYGHTHRPALYTFPGGKTVINVPSVGKPKHGNSHAGYCITQLVSGEMRGVEFRYIDYDKQKVRGEIIGRGLPEQTLRFLE